MYTIHFMKAHSQTIQGLISVDHINTAGGRLQTVLMYIARMINWILNMRKSSIFDWKCATYTRTFLKCWTDVLVQSNITMFTTDDGGKNICRTCVLEKDWPSDKWWLYQAPHTNFLAWRGTDSYPNGIFCPYSEILRIDILWELNDRIEFHLSTK